MNDHCSVQYFAICQLTVLKSIRVLLLILLTLFNPSNTKIERIHALLQDANLFFVFFASAGAATTVVSGAFLVMGVVTDIYGESMRPCPSCCACNHRNKVLNVFCAHHVVILGEGQSFVATMMGISNQSAVGKIVRKI